MLDFDSGHHGVYDHQQFVELSIFSIVLGATKNVAIVRHTVLRGKYLIIGLRGE